VGPCSWLSVRESPKRGDPFSRHSAPLRPLGAGSMNVQRVPENKPVIYDRFSFNCLLIRWFGCGGVGPLRGNVKIAGLRNGGAGIGAAVRRKSRCMCNRCCMSMCLSRSSCRPSNRSCNWSLAISRACSASSRRATLPSALASAPRLVEAALAPAAAVAVGVSGRGPCRGGRRLGASRSAAWRSPCIWR
jgi:hypothetical protein